MVANLKTKTNKHLSRLQWLGIFIIAISGKFGTRNDTPVDISFSLGFLAAIGFFIAQFPHEILMR